MTARGGIGTRPARIQVVSASKPSAATRRATLLRAEQTLLGPRLATVPGPTAGILIHDRRHRGCPHVPRTGSNAEGTAELAYATWPADGGELCQRGRKLTGKPVTKSNLRLRAVAQVAA